MSQSLQDIISSRQAEEPPEIAIIKQFIRDEFKAECSVKVQPLTIIIQVHSSALAGALRPYIKTLREACETDKRLTIRIS